MLTSDGTLHLKTARVFKPLLGDSRTKRRMGAVAFAELVVRDHVDLASGQLGVRTICVREVLKSLKESAKLLIEDKIKAMGVGHLFEIQKDRILAPGGGFIVFEGMQGQERGEHQEFRGL